MLTYHFIFFNVIPHVLPDGEKIRFWPGSSREAFFGDDETYAAKSKARLDKVKDFWGDPDSVCFLMTAAISSIPRIWTAYANIPMYGLFGVWFIH